MNESKKLMLAIAAIVTIAISILIYINQDLSDSFVKSNIDALCDDEVKGHCEGVEGICWFRCPHCNALFEAIDYKGTSYGMFGICPACHNSI